MANNKITKTKDLNGLFIYQDPKNGTVFYDIFTKKGYILTSSDIKGYTIFSSLLYLCLAITFLLTSMFKLDFVKSLLLLIALYILGQVIGRITFLYKLPIAKNFTAVKDEDFIARFAHKYSNGRLITLAILLTLLTILMPIYAKVEKMDTINTYICYFVSLITFICTIICIIAITKNNKENK